MSSIAIRTEALSKRYCLSNGRSGYRTIRETLAHLASTPWRSIRTGSLRLNRADAREEFWALRNVSLEAHCGEIIGIIGNNGAGKSTLLKILSRITEPSSGYADVFGRVGSLLEVGTGFHPELTGRENIYLSGAILGMKRVEINRKFEEIVTFAEVERFVDTPVKHYSSGMYLRLAFAVAVNLETEILFVDEVLAVGDAQFQKKCLDQLKKVCGHGLTIILVSHNMAAVRSICQRGIVLERGKVVRDCPIDEAVDWYINRSRLKLGEHARSENSRFSLESFEISTPDGSPIRTFGTLIVEARFRAKRVISDPSLVLTFLSPEHQRLAMLNFKDFGTSRPLGAGEMGSLGFIIEDVPFLTGEYLVEVVLKDRTANDWEPFSRLIPFEIVESPVYGGRKLDSWYGHVGLKARAFDEPRAVHHLGNH